MNLVLALNEKQIKKLTDFRKSVYEKIIWEQKNKFPHDPVHSSCWEQGYPYMGAMGGGETYQITPTSLGYVIKIILFKETSYEAEIDLTEYEDW